MKRLARKTSARPRRVVSAWYIYNENSNFTDLEPQADLLQDLVLGGDPPPEFVAECRTHGIATRKIVSGNVAAFDTDAAMRQTIDGYLHSCRTVGFDGLDLDFENLAAEAQDRFSLFMRTLAKELRTDGRQLSMCVGFYAAMYTHPPAKYFYDPPVVGEVCDEIRVMCYDMFYAPSPGIGPTSTRPWAKQAMEFWLAHVPRKKLLMGLPAYSNDFDLMLGGKGQQVYGDLSAITTKSQVEKVWLPYEEINSYRYQGADGHPHLCLASDEVSIQAHLKTVDTLNIPGITFWNYQAVTPAMWVTVREWLKKSGDAV